MVLKGHEKKTARLIATLAKRDNLNVAGWKLAHIEPIGLQKLQPDVCSIERLQRHLVSFLSPSNMFAVPKQWAGLGEVPEFVVAIREQLAT